MEQSLKKIPGQVYSKLQTVMKKYSPYLIDDNLMKQVQTECQAVMDESKHFAKSFVFCNNITNSKETMLKNELHVVIVYSIDGQAYMEHLTSMPSNIDKKQLSEFIKGQNVP